ncbi:MAG: hypothetical protein Tsb009_38770 [Planctomycetaceae bacterium]
MHHPLIVPENGNSSIDIDISGASGSDFFDPMKAATPDFADFRDCFSERMSMIGAGEELW